MKALILAPHHPNLPDATTEAAAVANSHPGSYLLAGTVTERDLAQAATLTSYDLFWVCTHATKTGIQLSNEHLDVQRLIPYISASGAHTVILNSCETIHIAAAILDATAANVIATITDVPDPQAARTGALYAKHLATLKDPREAYNRAKPTTGTYIYLANTKSPPKRKRGAPPKNRNALKHGYYSRIFTASETADIDALMSQGIDDEIYAMRVCLRRVLELANQTDLDYQEATRLLDTAGRASTTLATLLRTKRLLSPSENHDQILHQVVQALAKELAL